MFFPYKLILFLCFIIFLGYFEVNAKRGFHFRTKYVNIINEIDFPSGHKDFLDYTKALDKISKFALIHKDDIFSVNFYFGLFLVNVNLRNVSHHKTLTENLRRRLVRIVHNIGSILKRNTDAINNFKNSYGFYSNLWSNDWLLLMNDYELKIWNLLGDEKEWTKRLKKFNLDLLKKGKLLTRILTRDENHTMIYPDLDDYLYSVQNMDENIPSPLVSDKCQLLLLSYNGVNHFHLNMQCASSKECNDMLQNGDDFGYSMSHRFLYILLAHISRGCYIFSPERDRELKNHLCEMMYEEAKFIFRNNLPLVDLLMEHVTLCTLDGHAQFLHRSWLSKLLSLQTAQGCFKEENATIWPQSSVLHSKTSHSIKENCNLHTTGVGVSALAAAIRYMLEENRV